MEVFSLKLTADSVKEILKKCLVKDRDTIKKYESTHVDSPHRKVTVDNVCIVLGLNGRKYYFDAIALEQSRDEIKELLLQLPREFMRSAAMGGSSFLDACLNNEGHQWGDQKDVDELLALGKAVDLVQTAMSLPATLVMVMDARPTGKSQPQVDNSIAKYGKTGKISTIMIVVFSPLILAAIGFYMLVERISRRRQRYE